MKQEIIGTLTNVITTINQNGYGAFLTGTTARDFFLEEDVSSNYEISTPMPIVDLLKVFRKDLIVNTHPLLIVSNIPIKINILSISIGEDSVRRGFTINSIYYNSNRNVSYDFHNGRFDLQQRKIKLIKNSDIEIKRNPIRLIEAIRLATELNFNLDDSLMASLQANRELIKEVPVEQLRDEIFKISASKEAAKGFKLLFMSGMLYFISKELDVLPIIKQDPIVYPDMTVWEHTLQVIKILSKLNAGPLLVLAALFHDVGKAKCYQTYQEKLITRVINPGHEEFSSLIAGEALRKLKISENLRTKILNLVKNHTLAHEVKSMSPIQLHDFLKELYSQGILHEQILLEYADGIVGNGHCYSFYQEVLKEINFNAHQKLISGDDLIKKFKLFPGSYLGEVLTKIHKNQKYGLINTKKEALDFVEALIKEKRKR